MPKAPLNPFSLIAESWVFLKKQPALWHVLVWLLLLPAIAWTLLELFWPEISAGSEQANVAVFYLTQFILSFIAFWGFCCVLLVGRRMVGNRAGRSRTSFRTVRRESLWLIIPMFLTSLLRSFMTLYWSLLFFFAVGMFILFSTSCHVPLLAGIPAVLRALEVGNDLIITRVLQHVIPACSLILLFIPLLLPAILYSIRTIFYPIIVASEGGRYREALRRSRMVAQGKTLKIFWVLLGLGILLFIPPFLISIGLEFAQRQASLPFPIVALIVRDVLSALTGFFFTLALVALYGKLRRAKSNGPIEVTPDAI